jgi:hypothetical protein
MASGIYTNFKQNLMNGSYKLAVDTINVGLMTSSFSFNAANILWATVNANEISGTGYTAGGMALTGLSVTNSGTMGVWTASNVVWTSSTFSTAFAVIYDISASNNLIAAIDFGGTLSVSTGTFTIAWSVSGIITLS